MADNVGCGCAALRAALDQVFCKTLTGHANYLIM